MFDTLSASFDFQEAEELDSGKDSPEDVAANFKCAMFETPQDVLRGARHMVRNISP
jgi:transcription elongation factor SPT6